MAKLIFYYGVMGCSKTANALMTRFQYLDKNKSVWLIKPKTDNRDDIINNDGTTSTLIKSRVGIQAEAETISLDTDIRIKYLNKPYDVIICDEAQFLTENQVEQLRDIVSYFDIPVLCYGLRTDFKSKLFSGSKRLFELSDEIIELKSVCECGHKAVVNARINNKGEIITSGTQIEIGGDERYKPLCWSCWKKKITK